MGSLTKITQYQGLDITGYTSGSTGPAIIILHDWWGCTQSVRNFADRMANHDNRVMALDYYAGFTPTTVPEAERRLWSTDITDVTEVILPKAMQTYGDVHLIGMGFGSTLALIAQERISGIRSLTCCYGLPPMGRVKNVRAPLMVVRATRNRWDDPAHIQSYLDLAPRAQVMNHDCDAEFLNENATSFDFQRLRATAEAMDAWIKSNN